MPGPCDTPPPDDVHPADSTSITAASSAAAHLADFISRSFRREGRAAARFAGTGGRAMTKRFRRAVYSMSCAKRCVRVRVPALDEWSATSCWRSDRRHQRDRDSRFDRDVRRDVMLAASAARTGALIGKSKTRPPGRPTVRWRDRHTIDCRMSCEADRTLSGIAAYGYVRACNRSERGAPLHAA